MCSGRSFFKFFSKDYNQRITNERFEHRECCDCGSIFLYEPPADLGIYYSDKYHAILPSRSEMNQVIKNEQYKIELVQSYAKIKNHSLLEIGPGNGGFVYLAQEAGFKVTAIEMDRNCCKFINETLGAVAIQSDHPADTLNKTNVGEFDVIAMWHVIEHIPDARTLIIEISKHVSPGGVCLFAAPNPKSLQFKIMGKFWPHLDAPRHVTLISPKAIDDILLPLGFKKILHTTSDKGGLSWNLFGWQFFLKSFMPRWKLKVILEKIMVFIYTVAYKRREKKEGQGSAYTLIYKKI
jgi:SAM-dependent methyltransferase